MDLRFKLKLAKHTRTQNPKRPVSGLSQFVTILLLGELQSIDGSVSLTGVGAVPVGVDGRRGRG